ncbi:hypothetical protein TeGR_g2721, partial [Tetraparma gracilis]
MKGADSLKLFRALQTLATDIVAAESYVPEACYEDSDPENERAKVDVTVLPDQESSMALSFLLLACQAAGKFVAANAKTF